MPQGKNIMFLINNIFLPILMQNWMDTLALIAALFSEICSQIYLLLGEITASMSGGYIRWIWDFSHPLSTCVPYLFQICCRLPVTSTTKVKRKVFSKKKVGKTLTLRLCLMTLPNDRGSASHTQGRETSSRGRRRRQRRRRNKKLPKLQECDTDDCIAVAKYVTINYHDYIFF